MRVLVACEFSGRVRDAFRAKGHDAYSCDILPSEDMRYHLHGDVTNAIDCAPEPWDLLIAFPPCTHLAVSGARYFKDKIELQKDAIDFVEYLWYNGVNKVGKVAIENPVGVLSTKSKLGKPTQIIQPYEFGEPESKKTCLWLHNLPKLIPTNILSKPECGYWNNQTPSGQNKLGPSADRAKIRGVTYQGIATAMAEQWG